MVFRKISDMKEIIDYYFANADTDNCNVVLVGKQDKDNIIVFSRNLKYKWKQRNLNGIGIHIWDEENKIDIRFNSVKEHDDNFDILTLDDKWIFDLM